MTVDAAKDYLREHWPNIRAQLLEGTISRSGQTVEIRSRTAESESSACLACRQTDPASYAAVLQERGPDVFRAQLRLPTGALGPSSSGQAQRYIAEGYNVVLISISKDFSTESITTA